MFDLYVWLVFGACLYLAYCIIRCILDINEEKHGIQSKLYEIRLMRSDERDSE